MADLDQSITENIELKLAASQRRILNNAYKTHPQEAFELAPSDMRLNWIKKGHAETFLDQSISAVFGIMYKEANNRGAEFKQAKAELLNMTKRLFVSDPGRAVHLAQRGYFACVRGTAGQQDMYAAYHEMTLTKPENIKHIVEKGGADSVFKTTMSWFGSEDNNDFGRILMAERMVALAPYLTDPSKALKDIKTVQEWVSGLKDQHKVYEHEGSYVIPSKLSEGAVAFIASATPAAVACG